jgi:type I restriction enzyme S subunit
MSSDSWKKYSMGDVVDVTQGLAINAKTKHLFRENGLPLLRIADLFSGSYSQFISGEEVPKQCIAHQEEIIYTRTGQVGFVFTNKIGVVHNNCFKVTPKNGILSREFLYWFLYQKKVREYANTIASGSVQKDLTHSAFKTIEIDIPDLRTQNKISSIFRSIDDRITLLHETNATLEAIAQALFKSWFVDFDPIRAKQQGRVPEGMDETTAALFPDSFEESELGLMPKGWKIRTVGDITQQIFSGGTPDTRKSEYWIGQIPWFSSGETRQQFVVDTEKKINLEAVKNSSTKLALPGDILVASAGQGHTRGQTSFCAIETYINQSVVSVRTDPEKCHPIWLFYNLSRRYDEMRNISDSHSSRGSLTTKLLAGMHVVVPEYKLVNVFADTMIGLLDSQIHNSKRIAILSDLRNTLLPRLISGQLRLPEAEELLNKETIENE